MKKIFYILLSIAIIALILLVTMFNGNDSKNDGINYMVEEDCYSIETEYCDLRYPIKWKDYVHIIYNAEEEYIVEFHSDDVHLFDVIFNGDESQKIGSITLDNQAFSIGIQSYGIAQDQYDEDLYNEYCTMQEDLNVILAKLVEDYEMVLE